MAKKKAEEKKESEFGCGLTYCLGLFLAHTEGLTRMKETYKSAKIEGISWVALWFNGSSDHMYELQVPKGCFPKSLSKRLTEFQDKVLTWGHGFKEPQPTEADAMWAIDEAKELLRLIDEQFGVDTIVASYS